ncbi:hypothetical protein IWW36_004404 [Coemansia brasiliensis]|uniref:CBS domain-containing protein n=1 Tax=Coemansia brasiliensis TaxID=2650707 RepID=A0A9W8LXM2_9FUNG|nr:hypothetical protein IWW36_004404 [Coemansia brasiliensis]
MKAAALEQYTVQDILEYRGNSTLFYSIDENNSIENALALMYAHDIVSLPVFSTDSTHKFIDIVSVYDLRDYIMHAPELEKEVDFQLLSGRPSGKSTVLQDTIAQVVQSRKHASQEVSADMPLEELIRLFTTYKQHRVLVTNVPTQANVQKVPDIGRKRGDSIDSGCSAASQSNSDTAVCGLTQYDVVRFIQHHNHQLGSLLDAPALAIAQTHPSLRQAAPKHMPHITVRDTALKALATLSSTHASALPVVDYDGRLVTEIAGTSLRALTTRNIGLLGKPVLAFMFNLHMPVTRPYIIHENFTLSQIMTGLLQMNCRRAWLVDRDDRPIAVISLTDVLYHFL